MTVLGVGLAPVLVPFWQGTPVWLTVTMVIVPIVLAGLPLVVTHHRAQAPATWICAVLLAGLAVLFGLSIGMLMIPGAAVLLLAAGLTSAEHHRQHPQTT